MSRGRAEVLHVENKPKLEDLLREALSSVAIVPRGSQGRLAPGDYRRRVLAYRNLHHPALHLDSFMCELQIGNATVREAVLDFIRSELKQFLRGDRTYAATFAIFGGLGSGSSVDDILNSLVKAAITTTPRAAASAFYDEIIQGFLPYEQYFLLTGVKVEKEIRVFDRISLTPLPSSTQDLPSYLPFTFGRDPIEFLSKTLLRVQMSVSPVLHRPEQNYTFQSGPENHFNGAVRSIELADFHSGKFFPGVDIDWRAHSPIRNELDPHE